MDNEIIEYHQNILEDIWQAVELEAQESAHDGFTYQAHQLEMILDALSDIEFEEE